MFFAKKAHAVWSHNSIWLISDVCKQNPWRVLFLIYSMTRMLGWGWLTQNAAETIRSVQLMKFHCLLPTRALHTCRTRDKIAHPIEALRAWVVQPCNICHVRDKSLGIICYHSGYFTIQLVDSETRGKIFLGEGVGRAFVWTHHMLNIIGNIIKICGHLPRMPPFSLAMDQF